MNLKLDENQQFILDQIKYGLANKPSSEPITDVDIERLSWPAPNYSDLPSYEWNEWSRKIHWALQYSFSYDTSNLKDKERLMVWRKKCVDIVSSALAKSNKEQIVLESATIHFVEQDLLHFLVDVYGFKNLTDQEKKMISVFSGVSKHAGGKGCLSIVLV